MPHVFTFHARQVFASALPQSSIPWTALLSGKAARGSGKAEPGSNPPCYKAGSASSGTSVFKKNTHLGRLRMPLEVVPKPDPV